MIPAYRYYCTTCRWQGNDTDVALYHDLILAHQVVIEQPEIQWRTEYVCGCWSSPEESHCCDKHIQIPLKTARIRRRSL
jgi:hypothetical protein